jgi:hypothetical protein
MTIELTVNGKTIIVTLIDSETTRDVISLLLLRLTMNDLFRREKARPACARDLQGGETDAHVRCRATRLLAPGPDLSIFYRQDNETIADPASSSSAKYVPASKTSVLAVPSG